MNTYKIVWTRHNAWDVHPQNEPKQEATIEAISERDAISRFVELPDVRVSPPIIVSCKEVIQVC
jgi:hypothetical protein